MKVLEVKDLSFGYDKKTKVLSGLNMSIEQGTINALLGRNGCGKSTLLDCIMNLNESDGEILINGLNSKELSTKQRALQIAYVKQNTIINMDYLVSDFILFGRNPHLSINSSLSKEDYFIMEGVAKRCGIEHLLHKSINKLSGGERSLAFIARALAQDSSIIIMDEPTASLDFGNQFKLFGLMKEIVNDGKTIIFTTHNPNHAIDLECNTLIMYNGIIISKGEAKEVLNSSILKEIYDCDFKQQDGYFRFK